MSESNRMKIKKTLYPDRIRSAIKSFGKNLALSFGDRRYSYNDLDSITGRLAAYLISQDIGCGDIVSVLISRNEYITIAPLGIIRSGAAYQPLDISHPTDRIRSMIENAGSQIVIVEKEYEHLLDDVNFGTDRKKLYIEDIPLLPEPEEGPWPYADPEDDFAILYTSGSTGEPKGIEITHRNIISLLDWYIDYYGVDENSRIGQHTSYVFDPAIAESMLPLAAGAAIFIIPEEIRTDLFLLDRFYNENKITHASLTTQLGRQFAMHMEGRTLKHLVVGGEALMSVAPPKNYTLHNGYGPAEGTLLITIFAVLKEYPNKVPLGSPLPEVKIYLLDEKGRQVSDGQPGELCFAGAHVTKGYLNRPDLTAKVYTVNPFSDDPEYSRLYHTGDLVKKDADGYYEYLGRIDRQVKIRGFRIEPAEIEAILKGCEGIDDAVVVPLDMGNEKMLAAYYLSNASVDEKLLSDLILSQKPSYMLPSFFIHMDSFPLTINGKIDYNALPGPMREATSQYEEPKSDTERVLAGLYRDILGIEHVGRQDNFLHLGGTSMSSAILLYNIFDAFSCRIGIRDIMEHPVLYDLADRIDEKLLSKETDNISFEQKLLPLQAEYDVSYSQNRMFTAQELLGYDDPTYLLRLKISIDGAFDKSRIQNTIKALILRHESLRTEFFISQDSLKQIIVKPTEAWLNDAVIRTEDRDLFPGFSMEEAPLFAWSASENEIEFQWHHIISDGVSSSLFAQEFIEAYNGNTLPPLRVHQKEYAEYEKQYMASPLYKKSLDSWRNYSSDHVDAEEIKLPQDNTFLPGMERIAGHFKSVLPKSLSEEINIFCHEKNITVYMFLLSVFSILLHRYTRMEKLILGTVMDGRNEPGTDKLQGMFVNTLPLFITVSDDYSISDFYSKISEIVLFSMENQSVPLEEIADAFSRMGGYQRTSHGSLLFDYLFVLQNFKNQVEDIDGCEVSLEYGDGGRAMYDLTLEMEEMEDGFHCDFEYCRGLFSEESIRVFAHHFEVLLSNCLSSSDKQTIGSLSVIDENEQKKLLYDFQGGPLDERALVYTVVDLLRDRARENPDSTAVVFCEETLSYRGLWDKSGLLANKLNQLFDQNTENHAVIFANRGISMITTIWAVLRAGGAYVPVSPEYPDERISYILDDCNAVCVIECDAKVPDAVRELLSQRNIPVISGNDLGDTVEFHDGLQHEVQIHENKLPGYQIHGSNASGIMLQKDSEAYMIYTSGTTGEPKGVVVSHGNLSALLFAYNDIYKLTPQDAVLQFADFVFDQSVWEIFHILTVGGTLCMITSDMARDPQKLSYYCNKNHVTVSMQTPGFLRLLDPDEFKGIRLVDVGGEAPDYKLLKAWSKGRTVLNTYGPTETTVNAASYIFSENGRQLTAEKDNVPIGKPIDGTRIYILDGDRLCGIGMPGELCIAGAQVTLGYYNRPQLTGEKFVKDPFFDGAMYRSGDLARYLPDGNIEFSGRIDDQIKLRGYRIELGEIESAIRRVPGIKDAVCTLQDTGDNKTLCGYYILNDTDTAVTEDELRQLLSEQLPSYMVPVHLMPLLEFPLTVSGKINKRALPKFDMVWQDGDEGAKTDIERDLADAFAAVLQLERVSVTADFIALGGDSIKAIRIVSLLREKGYHLSAGHLLKNSTIRSIAPLLKKTEGISYKEFDHVSPTPVMKLFFAADMPNSHWYNQSVMLLMKNYPGEDALNNALSDLISAHGCLRMIRKDGGIVIRDISKMPSVKLAVLENCTKSKREDICTRLQSSMDPDNGIVMQAAIFKNDNEHRLFLAFHHLVIDEVSWGIILEDLDRLLNHEALYDRTISFGEWSQKLWSYSKSDDFIPEKAYWMRQYKELKKHDKDIQSWLSSYEDLNTQKTGFSSLSLSVSDDMAQKLSSIAALKYQSGMDAFLLAVLIHTIKLHDNISSISIQMESHGRGNIGDVHCDRTVGWFTALYPVLFDVADTFDEQIVVVKKALLDVPNYGIGYGLLYDDLFRQGGIVFNYLGNERKNTYDNFGFAGESSGLDMDAANGDPYTISIDIRQDEQGLFIDAWYDNAFDGVEIKGLLNFYKSKLEEISGLVPQGNKIYAPNDLCADSGMSLSDWYKLTQRFLPESVMAIARLTPLQQGMLYRYIAEPEGRAYFLQDKLTISGVLQKEKLKAALKLLSLRYDALRTVFLYDNLDEPWQIILKERTPEFVDMSDLAFSDVLAIDGKRGFSLTKDPLMRLTVCKQKNGSAEILISMHHMITDGWSFPILTRKLMEYYRDLCSGADESIIAGQVKKEAADNCSFTDYLRYCAGLNRPKITKKWVEYLQGADEGAAPYVFDPDNSDTFIFAERSFRISREMEDRIRAYTVQNHITTSSFFGALWGILLGFESGVENVVFAETLSGRNADIAGIESAVGIFIHTIPVCIRLRDSKTVLDLMKKRQEDYISMQPYENAALSEIGAATGFGSALIRSLYVYENYPVEDEADWYHINGIHEEVDYAITFCVEETDGISLNLLFDENKYHRDYIGLLMDRLIYLAHQVLTDEAVTVFSLDRITPEEQKLTLLNLAGENMDFPKKSFPEMFFDQAKDDPSRSALLMDGKTISYGKLLNASCGLAKEIGPGEERFIAVMADRGFELIASLIGTMLAGAAYVPLDPDYPVERIRYILNDCVPTCVLYYVKEEQPDVRNLFEEYDIPVISTPIDTFESKDHTFKPGQKLMCRLAYMIYTSGTTGEPKGVEIEHCSLSDMIYAHEVRFGSLYNDTVLFMSNFVFDASVQQIFTPLAQGGRVCIITKERMNSSKEIAQYCRDNNVTFIGATNALLRILSPADFDGIRVLSIGGDEADPGLFEKWSHYSKLIINDYGPTEATIHAISHAYTSGEKRPVPLGKPYPNKRIYIMQGDKLCGIGQQGEICIGGKGLARGYHGRPELTDRHFGPDPYSDGRIYRTGDLGLYRPDGQVLFKGRNDSQVKIRGFRIELQEIDSRLMSYDGIKDAVTICRQEKSRENYLISYVTSNNRIEIKKVTSYLRSHLPAYMVPAFVIPVDIIPLNFSGKVDVGRLPDPKPDKRIEYEKPQNDLEERIAGLFERILGRTNVGRNDSFIDLGGTSLDMMRLLSGLNDPGIRLADIASNPTPESLSGILRNRYQKQEGCLLLWDGDPYVPQIFCVPPSGGMSLCYLELFRQIGYRGRIYGLTDEKYKRFGSMTIEELEGYDILREDLWEANLLSYMESIQSVFKAGDILIGYSQGGAAAHELALRLEGIGKPCGRLIMLEAVPFGTDESRVFEAESENDRLKAVENIFFGSEVYRDDEDVTEISLKERLLEMLEGHGSALDEAMLHALFETYLVYSINTLHPLTISGRTRARIDSVLLPGDGEKEAAQIILSDKDPWIDYTLKKGESCRLGHDGNEHLVFLSKYKTQIAAQLKKWLETDKWSEKNA